MASDGKVIISTALDNTGLEKGIGSISGSLGGLKSVIGKLGAAIGAAFSAAAIVNFCKGASNAAMQLSDALTGLKSAVDGHGRSFSSAQAFIEEYTADGLIPATNAAAAYKNLLSRGYDDSQIRSVMNALKDASAYGRQASLSMGEAVQSATEGLKNENSILVDNAGVTKNVSKMWDNYAASIGTTAANLTQAQKIQAEVNGILEESKYQTGDAAKVAGTLSGQIQQLSFNFNNLKVAVGNAINPILQGVLPVINAAIAGFTKLANSIAAVMGALFGSAKIVSSAATGASEVAAANEGIAESAAAGADAQNDLAKGVSAASKAAKKSIAGFDELTTLQEKSSSGGGGGGSGGSGGGTTGGSSSSSDVEAVSEVTDTLSPKIQAVIGKINELLTPLRNIDLGPLKQSFSGLGDAISRLGAVIGDVLEWAWYNILVPLAAWTIEETAPAALDLLSAALGILTEILIALQPLGTWLWENFLQPIATWTGGVIITILQGLTDALNKLSSWISKNQPLVRGITIALVAFMAVWKATDLIMWVDAAQGIPGLLKSITTTLAANTAAKVANKAEDIAIIALYVGDYIRAFAGFVAKMAVNTASWVANTAAKVASTAAEWAQIAATTAWNAICTVAATVTTAFGAAIAFLTSPIGIVVVAITALIAIIVLLVKNWDTVKEVASKVWEGIKSAWGNVSSWFKSKVLDPLSNGFKNMVNGIIGFINGMIRAIVNGVNSVVRAVNRISFTVPSWVPGIGGSTLGFNLRTVSCPQIPYLAQGAVLPANKPFMAVLGDQKHGTNIEAPLSTIQEAVAAVMGDQVSAMMAGFNALLEENQRLRQVVEGIELGDTTIGQAANRYQQKVAIMRGG